MEDNFQMLQNRKTLSKKDTIRDRFIFRKLNFYFIVNPCYPGTDFTRLSWSSLFYFCSKIADLSISYAAACIKYLESSSYDFDFGVGYFFAHDCPIYIFGIVYVNFLDFEKVT